MPRRRVFTDAQITALFALPTAEADLIRHYTLQPDDLVVIARRRRIAAPGPTTIERMVATALLQAERPVPE